jgi:uncharacterized protein (DUF885 family)
MTRFSHGLWSALLISALLGCGRAPVPSPAPPAKSAAPPDQLSRIVERYWDEHIPVDNELAPQRLADSLNIERRYLAEISAAPRTGLDANWTLTYDLFKRQREMAVQGFTFPAELLPLNPFGGVPQHLAALAADSALQPLSAAECETWLRRIDEYVRWTKQAIVNMREGARRGYTAPRALIERMLPILERLGADDSANVFHELVRASRLSKNLSVAVGEKLLPANRALHDFLQHEYLPLARSGIALSELPLGAQWYAYRMQRATSTALSADEIHRIGIAEVERIGAHAKPMRDQQPQEAAVAPPLGAAELLGAYQDLAGRVGAALPKLFSAAAATDLAIRAADSLSEPATPLYYLPPGTGMHSGVLYVKIPAASVSIAGFLQQATPGHEYQITLQRQRIELPRFRRFGVEPAFNEGWGLYAATLGEELGLYPDDAARLEAVAGDMRCAVGLVVDTGVHAKGWTRAMASDYLHAHLSIGQADSEALIDWYAANPGDALACKIGELRIRSIREHAQQMLGGRFQLRDFHDSVLKDGAMPLDMLEARMKAWMDGVQ